MLGALTLLYFILKFKKNFFLHEVGKGLIAIGLFGVIVVLSQPIFSMLELMYKLDLFKINFEKLELFSTDDLILMLINIVSLGVGAYLVKNFHDENRT